MRNFIAFFLVIFCQHAYCDCLQTYLGKSQPTEVMPEFDHGAQAFIVTILRDEEISHIWKKIWQESKARPNVDPSTISQRLFGAANKVAIDGLDFKDTKIELDLFGPEFVVKISTMESFCKFVGQSQVRRIQLDQGTRLLFNRGYDSNRRGPGSG